MRTAPILGGAAPILSGTTRVLSGATRVLSGAARILGGAARILGGAARILSGTEAILSGTGQIFAGAGRTHSPLPHWSYCCQHAPLLWFAGCNTVACPLTIICGRVILMSEFLIRQEICKYEP